VSARELRVVAAAVIVAGAGRFALADSVGGRLREGNRLYTEGSFAEAIGRYDQVLLERPEALEPQFNKANSYYRLDDLQKATDLYRQVAAESRDMVLVSKAKYNLGNCFFQRGSKQRDSDLQKALDDFKASITHWRQVLDIDPKNEKAARNIEVARLIIKDIIDQINKQRQQQDPNQPQDANQPQDPNQSQQHQQSQTQQASGQDPNQAQETRQPQDANQAQDPNQPRDPNQSGQQQQIPATDATAQEILDNEQRQKQQRQIMQRARYQKVDKDW
jgi:tetratricopeptide (TPR) repeat protein